MQANKAFKYPLNSEIEALTGDKSGVLKAKAFILGFTTYIVLHKRIIPAFQRKQRS